MNKEVLERLDFKTTLEEFNIKSRAIEKYVRMIDSSNEKYSNILQEFTIYKVAEKDRLGKNKNNETIERYLRYVIEFLNFYGEDPEDIKKRNCEDYVEYLKYETELTVNCINLKIASINQLLNFLEEKYDKRYKKTPKVFEAMQLNIKDEMITNDDVKRILRQSRKVNDIRMTTMIYVMFYTGLRVSEMLQLRITDVDKKTTRINGKGDKMRKVFFSTRLRKQLKEYAEYRATLPNSISIDNLFIGERGAVTRQTVHKELKKYAGKARVKKDIVSPHKFRHLCANNLESLGIKQTIISQLLGHRLSVTERYTSITEKELLKIVDKIELEHFIS